MPLFDLLSSLCSQLGRTLHINNNSSNVAVDGAGSSANVQTTAGDHRGRSGSGSQTRPHHEEGSPHAHAHAARIASHWVHPPHGHSHHRHHPSTPASVVDPHGGRANASKFVSRPWSGYVVTDPHPMHSIEATWEIPKAPHTPNNYYMWVGLGGFGTHHLEQDGISGENNGGGGGLYQPWEVNLPGSFNSSNFFGNKVPLSPGDKVTAITQDIPQGHGRPDILRYTVRNDTTGQQDIINTHERDPNLNSAEVVLEDTGSYHHTSGQVNFQDIKVDGRAFGSFGNVDDVYLPGGAGTPGDLYLGGGGRGSHFDVSYRPGPSQRN